MQSVCSGVDHRVCCSVEDRDLVVNSCLLGMFGEWCDKQGRSVRMWFVNHLVAKPWHTPCGGQC